MSSLHDILAYTCAYAWLGSSGSLIDDKKFQSNNTFGAEWGGLEGIGVCVCVCAQVIILSSAPRCGAKRLTVDHQQAGRS